MGRLGRSSARQGAQRIPPFAASAAIHGLFVAWVVFGPRVAPGPIPETRASLDKKFTIVWYPKPKIPDISPRLNPPAKKAIPRPLPRAAQTILSTQRDAKPARQLVWQPPPVIRLKQEIPAPNMVRLSVPVLPAPPKPAPRVFTPPLPTPRTIPQSSTVVALSAPDLAEAKLAQPTSAAVPVAASLPKLPPRRFSPPTAKERSVQPPEATSLDAPPPITLDAENRNLNVLIVGLNPADQLKAPVPPGSLPSQVSARPDEKVASNAGGSPKGSLSVPNVIIRGGTAVPPAAAPVLPRATPEERAKAAGRATVSAPLRASSRSVPAVVESNFGEQTVYTCLLEMPAAAQGIGDSVLWFAEQGAKAAGALLMRAPVLVRAGTPISPGNIQKGAEPKVYLKLWIGKEGLVKSASLLKASADPLIQAVLNSSMQWEFVPATRNGQPVDIDAILEVPLQSVAQASGK